jgi:rhodanese-related sulfurtransferase
VSTTKTPHRRFKDDVYGLFAIVGKAVSAPKRLELLDLLCQGPRTVEVLADLSNISMANASQHLQVLKAARLVESEKRGLHAEYRLADESVERFYLALRNTAEGRLAEVKQITRDYLHKASSLEAVPEAELLRRVRAAEVTVLDVRPTEEYQAGHIPGAVSMPLDDLKKHLATLPKDRDVVAYCRGPYCVMSVDAVALLKKHGFTAHRMEMGVSDWKARGWRIAAA